VFFSFEEGFTESSSESPETDFPFVVALLQMDPDGADLEANARKAVEFCRQAAAQGADLALMPEMWSIGYTRSAPAGTDSLETFRNRARSKDSDYVRQFAELAKELDMAIGTAYLEAYDPWPRNTVTVFDRHGNEVLTYAKVHTSDFKHMETNMTPGDGFYAADLDTRHDTLRIGAMICFDREQPESARVLMLEGAEIILTPNACRLDDNRIDQFKVRAFENVVGVAMANYSGLHYRGRSVAFSPEGECLVEAGFKEGIYVARFDMAAIRAKRAKSIHGNAYRRPHRYGAIVSTEKDEVWKRLDGNGEPWNANER